MEKVYKILTLCSILFKTFFFRFFLSACAILIDSPDLELSMYASATTVVACIVNRDHGCLTGSGGTEL